MDSLKGLLTPPPKDSSRVELLNALARNYAGTDLDTAVRLSHEALSYAEELGWEKGIASSSNHLGIFSRHQSRYSDALQHFRRALRVFKATGYRKGMASVHSNMGLVHSNTGDYPRAFEHYYKALRIKRESKDSLGIASTLGNLGIVHHETGDHSNALKNYYEALMINEKLGRKDMNSNILSNIGIVHSDRKEYGKALEYYRKALKAAQEAGKEQFVTNTLGNIGNLYRDIGDKGKMDSLGREEAYFRTEDHYQRALKRDRKRGDQKGVAIWLQNLGNLYLTIYKAHDSIREPFLRKSFPRPTEGPGQLQEGVSPYQALLDTSITLHNKSYEIRKRIGDQTGLVGSMLSIASLHEIQNEARKAIGWNHDAYRAALRNGVMKEARKAARSLYQLHKEEGRSDSALFWFERFKKHEDSLYNAEKEQAIGKLHGQRRMEKKMLEIEEKRKREKAIAREKNRQQRLIIQSVSGGLLLVLLFAFILYRRFRVTKRQRDIIDRQKKEVDQAYGELQTLHEQVREKNEEITSSIDYAKKIQDALLQRDEQFSGMPFEHFVLFLPQATVSGDFYWVREHKGSIYFAALDCTGHGVPGAFMSMLGISQLNEIMNTDEELTPGEVLTELRERVVRELSGSDPESTAKDGMDAAVVKIPIPNPNSQFPTEGVGRRQEAVSSEGVEVEFAGAQNPLYVIRKGIGEDLPASLKQQREGREGHVGSARQPSSIKPFKKSSDGIEIKGDSMPVGYDEHAEDAFTTMKLQLQKGDMLYIFSDGYADQFGGEKGKKFRYAPFKSLLADLHQKGLEEQKKELERSFMEWKGDRDQVDDVVVMGIRL